MTYEPENEYRLKDEPQPANNQSYQPQAPVYIPGGSYKKPKKSFFGRLFKFVTRLIMFGFYGFGIFMIIGIIALVSGNIVNTEVIIPGDEMNKIAVIDLDGIINMENYAKVNRMLTTADNDKTIKGVIISVNSPGGMVVPSDMIAHDIEMFKRRSGKPVYVSVQQLSASGAYWATAGCDRIFAQTNSRVGSIGVIYSSFVIKDTLDKIGIAPIVIKSSKSPSKDKGSMFRMPTEQEQAEIQKDIDTFHDRFINIVAKGRMLSEETVTKYATGEVFDGPESIEAGLIDQIGFIEDTIASLSSELAILNPQVIRISPTPSFKDILTKSQSLFTDNIDLKKQYHNMATSPKIQALWMGN